MGIADIRPPDLPDPSKRRNLRVSMGLSVTQLAANIGVSESAVRKWENGAEPTGLQRAHYAQTLTEIEDYLESQE